MKQTSSFSRWRRRYFKLQGTKLYYAKNNKAVIFDEIDLSDSTVTNLVVRNVAHTFQVISPCRRLALAAESRCLMEEWVSSLKAASNRTGGARLGNDFESGDQHDFLSGQHHWYATSHARPTYCNLCRDALSGVTSHGLSCGICKCKAHKRCAAKAVSNCKWTTLASVGKDIIEDEDGNIVMPHQWVEGNLPVSSKCTVCDKTCGSVLRLQDWRCLWCRACVHTACRPAYRERCPLGPAKISTLPPTALHSVGTDEAWEAVRPQGCSPLLVFVNSKSGDNQGVRFLRRFKQLLNPAQVFDLIGTGPGLGLRLFRHFDPFRILICSGDGSVGWVLSEIDRLNMHKQCQVGVLPLGTGNDLARVLGWGSSCDDETLLTQLLEQYEKACTKMLDRWSIMAFERNISIGTGNLSFTTQVSPPMSTSAMAAYDNSFAYHTSKILQSDDIPIIINAAQSVCEKLKYFALQLPDSSPGKDDKDFEQQCKVVPEKLDLLLQTLGPEGLLLLRSEEEDDGVHDEEKASLDKSEKDYGNQQLRLDSNKRQQLLLRSNSLKKAVRKLVELTEQAVDDQSKHTTKPPMDTLKVHHGTDSGSSSDGSRCPSPALLGSRLTALSPLPDLRRDSGGEDLFPIPVPKEFADRRRSSAMSVDSVTDYLGRLSHRSSLQPPDGEESRQDVLDPASKVSGVNETHIGRSDAHGKVEPNRLPILPELSSEMICNTTSKVRRAGLEGSFLQVAEDPNRRFSFGGFSTDGTSTTTETDTVKFEKCKRPNRGRHSVDSGEDPVWRCFALEASEIADIKHIDSSETSEESAEGAIRLTNTTDVSKDSPVLKHDSIDRHVIGGQNGSEHGDGTDPLVTSGEDNESEDDVKFAIGLSGHAQYTEGDTDPAIKCTLAHFVEGNDIARRSIKCRHIATRRPEARRKTKAHICEESHKTTLDVPLLQVDENFDEDELLPASSIGNLSDEMDPYLKGFKVYSRDPSPEEKKSEPETAEGILTNLSVPEPCRSNRSHSLGGGPTPPSSAASTGSSTGCLFPENDQIQIHIQGSNNNLTTGHDSDTSAGSGGGSTLHIPSPYHLQRKSIATSSAIYQEKERIHHSPLKKPNARGFPHPVISVVVDPPSPTQSEEDKHHLPDDNSYRRYSCDSAGGKASPQQLWRCSPAASRRISSGSLLKVPAESGDRSLSQDDSTPGPRQPFRDRLRSSVERDLQVSIDLMASVSAKTGASSTSSAAESEAVQKAKSLPIINPLVRLPMWPNVSSAGMISKALLANADALCAAASPLMDPDETLLEGFFERCVMNNYFGIGIDAKISLDFHHKREEHPEKCRSRAKNYIWYGVLGSKEWLQKTYKNLDQRVQLECDGQKIPLPSLQGIVILNIPSFMGGTNFWGGTKEDDVFLAPSFDDRVLEVVAVFGSMQMAASRLINLQHHRIAQCQTVQINILGDEGVPIQVDGEAWIQPPGMIRIIHKNRMQMLCRNRALENSLRAWEEKQRSHLPHLTAGLIPHDRLAPFNDEEFSLLLGFIDASTTLVRCVKLLTIRHPSIEADLYDLAAKTHDSLEHVHPGGKLLTGGDLRPAVTGLVASARQLHEESCQLLREKAHKLRLREDLEGQLSSALSNMEVELRKCNNEDGCVTLQPLPPGENERKGKARGLFWLRFRRGERASHPDRSRQTAADVATWGTAEVASWLESIQLGEYIDSFTCHDIRGKELLTLARRDLKELGVTKVGHVKRILQAVRDLNS
ncbi:diacylglycerol kinase eta isoform X2 [Thrips palmi]|nr:diacylglycerol kinase eta isoform X2 [Thrips palmi]XP_034232120.1 diacylglycerol kinase eta isoform X2 [Thrips palmi]